MFERGRDRPAGRTLPERSGRFSLGASPIRPRLGHGPFIGTGRYTSYKQATDTLAHAYADRFHLYGPGEIAYRDADNSYLVTEGGGAPAYSFANPDFSFRQFRSNLVARWEWKPGSSVYLVWSQGRTDQQPYWEDAFQTNWNALWGTRADNVFLVKFSYWFSP